MALSLAYDIFISLKPDEALLIEDEAERQGFGSVAATVKELCKLPHSARDRRKNVSGPQSLRLKPERLLNKGRLRYSIRVDEGQFLVLQEKAGAAKVSPGVYLKQTSLRLFRLSS